MAPALCFLEFGNGILKAVRQQWLSEADANFAHRKLALLPVEFREFVAAAKLPMIHVLAQRRSLSF